MNQWQEILKKLAPKLQDVYDVRPGERGPYLYCSMCGKVISQDDTTSLTELVKEAQQHEDNFHKLDSPRNL